MSFALQAQIRAILERLASVEAQVRFIQSQSQHLVHAAEVEKHTQEKRGPGRPRVNNG